MKKLLGCAMAVAVLASIALVSAQERKREAQDQNKGKQKTETTPQAGRGHADSQLVSWLVSGNEGEIALAKFAAERASNEQVKKFAQKMIEDHSEFVSKLKRIAPLASESTDPAASKRRDEARPVDPTRTTKPETAQTKPGDTSTITRSYSDPESRVDLLRIKQEIDKQCLESLKKELGEKSGADFDFCYMGQQIMAHLGMMDTLKVMKSSVSPELRRLIEDGEKAADEHFDNAKDIMKQLGGVSGKR